MEPIGAVGSGASGPCLSLTLEGGSFGTVAGALTAQGTAGSWQVAGGVDLRRSDGDFLYARDLTPNLPDDPWVVEQRRNNASAAATVLVDAVRSGDEGRTRITVLGHRGERGAPGLVGYPTAGATSEATRLAAGLETAGRSSAGPLALTTWLSYDAQAYDPGEDPAPGAGSAAAYGRSTVGAQLVQHVARGPHHLRLGLRGETESLEISQARRWTRVPARAAAALYGAETYALGPAWTLLGALRIEAWSDGPLWLSPRLGARYDPPRAPGEAGFALFANLGQGVRMPTLFERYGESAFLRPNPELRPERAWTVDLGAEWRGLPGGGVGLSLRGALFASLYEDLITYELFPPFRLKPFNTRSARILGAEVEASLSWGPLRAWLAYAFTEARALSGSPWEAGRALPYRPPHRGSGGCVLSVWRLEIFTEAEGQSTYARNRTETLFVPGWITLATGLRLRLTERFEFSAVVENLLDDQRRQDVFGFPLPGRSFLASLRFTPPLGD
ncbi:MAG: TonB-dependent receptor [Deltaproteobacteria bacterium]|nr:MAG: TonB-dependent receptor [Deltaproteobacteria bacterium]